LSIDVDAVGERPRIADTPQERAPDAQQHSRRRARAVDPLSIEKRTVLAAGVVHFPERAVELDVAMFTRDALVVSEQRLLKLAPQRDPSAHEWENGRGRLSVAPNDDQTSESPEGEPRRSLAFIYGLVGRHRGEV
jgi:hypothetical protein